MLSYAEFCDKFNIRLDAQQAQAVQCTDRAVLLLAVPGSGKTTTLITRVAYLVYCMGIAPENILTMTYTVAASAEMRARFSAAFGEEYAKRLEFRTINGVCASRSSTDMRARPARSALTLCPTTARYLPRSSARCAASIPRAET